MGLKLLDKDLALELSNRVKRDGLLWASMPMTLKMEYLAPFIARQVKREERMLGVSPRGVAA